MKTSDFYLKPSSNKINESIEKKFGGKLDLENYSNDQLIKASKLIENNIIEHKKNGFNAALDNEEYHRLTFMKDAVITALAERKLTAAEKNKREEIAKAIEKKDPKMDKSKKMAIATAQAKKKKVSESMQTMEELAMHHAMEYARHHMSGNIDHMKHHKTQCEECGGIITHRGMGECWFTHGSKPPKRILSPISGNTGIDTMTAEAKKAKPDFLDFDKDGNKKEPMKKALKDKKVDEVSAATLGRYKDAAKTSDTSGMSKTKQFKRSEQMPNLAQAKIAAGKSDDDSKYALNRYYMTGAKKVKVPATNESSNDLRDSVLEVLKTIYNGASAGEEMIDYLADEFGQYYDQVEASGDQSLQNAYSFMMDNGQEAESDPQAMAKTARQAVSMLRQGVAEAKKAKPDFLDMDKDGNKKESMKKALKDKKKSMNESPNYEDAMNRKLRKRETIYEAVNRLMNEGEEGKAELVMAVKDMVDKFTAWSEDIASMQATAAMEMADQIRDELGSDQSEAFKQAISPALDAAFQAVKAAREAMNNQVAAMTGGAPAMTGGAPAMSAGPDLGGPEMGGEEPAPDMGGEEPATDMPPPEGREKRESIERHRRLARILAGS